MGAENVIMRPLMDAMMQFRYYFITVGSSSVAFVEIKDVHMLQIMNWNVLTVMIRVRRVAGINETLFLYRNRS